MWFVKLLNWIVCWWIKMQNFIVACVFMCLHLLFCIEWNVPVSPVHTLRNEVQSDVQGQPNRAHSGRGGTEHLISWGERGLRYSCCHKGDKCKNTVLHITEETHSHTCIYRTHTHTRSVKHVKLHLGREIRKHRPSSPSLPIPVPHVTKKKKKHRQNKNV